MEGRGGGGGGGGGVVGGGGGGGGGGGMGRLLRVTAKTELLMPVKCHH